jgi:hypothetical protein
MASENEPLNLDDYLPAERQYYSIGYVASMFGQPPHFIISLAHDAGVGPVYSHNGVPTFDGKAVERMAEHLKLNVEFASKAEAAPSN